MMSMRMNFCSSDDYAKRTNFSFFMSWLLLRLRQKRKNVLGMKTAGKQMRNTLLEQTFAFLTAIITRQVAKKNLERKSNLKVSVLTIRDF